MTPPLDSAHAEAHALQAPAEAQGQPMETSVSMYGNEVPVDMLDARGKPFEQSVRQGAAAVAGVAALVWSLRR